VLVEHLQLYIYKVIFMIVNSDLYLKHLEFMSTDDMNLYKLCAFLGVVNMDHNSQNVGHIFCYTLRCLGTDY